MCLEKHLTYLVISMTSFFYCSLPQFQGLCINYFDFSQNISHRLSVILTAFLRMFIFKMSQVSLQCNKHKFKENIYEMHSCPTVGFLLGTSKQSVCVCVRAWVRACVACIDPRIIPLCSVVLFQRTGHSTRTFGRFTHGVLSVWARHLSQPHTPRFPPPIWKISTYFYYSFIIIFFFFSFRLLFFLFSFLPSLLSWLFANILVF